MKLCSLNLRLQIHAVIVSGHKLFRPFQNGVSKFFSIIGASLLQDYQSFTSARLNCVPQFVALGVELHFLYYYF